VICGNLVLSARNHNKILKLNFVDYVQKGVLGFDAALNIVGLPLKEKTEACPFHSGVLLHKSTGISVKGRGDDRLYLSLSRFFI
jgi:hypothetical protein